MKCKYLKKNSIAICILSGYIGMLTIGAIGCTNLYIQKLNKQTASLCTDTHDQSPSDKTHSTLKKDKNNSISPTSPIATPSNTNKAHLQAPKTANTTSAPKTPKTHQTPSVPSVPSNNTLKGSVTSKQHESPKSPQKFLKPIEPIKPVKPIAPTNLVKKELKNSLPTTLGPKNLKEQINSLFSWVVKPSQRSPKENTQKPTLKIPKQKPIAAVASNQRKEKKKNPADTNYTKTKTILARVTVYWAYGSGTDKWSAKKQSSTGTKLECGKHAAVDPKVIPYGSKLEVQKNGREVLVKAVDTGSAVKARKASIAMAKNNHQRQAPVIDLFFENKSDALHYAKSNPPYQWVDVRMPN